MPKIQQSVSPKLHFSDPHSIAPGIIVHPIYFGLNKTPVPFRAAYFQVLPGHETPIDCHQEEENWIVMQGSGILQYEGFSYPITEQDIFFFASFKKHQAFNNSDTPLLICSHYW